MRQQFGHRPGGANSSSGASSLIKALGRIAAARFRNPFLCSFRLLLPCEVRETWCKRRRLAPMRALEPLGPWHADGLAPCLPKPGHSCIDHSFQLEGRVPPKWPAFGSIQKQPAHREHALGRLVLESSKTMDVVRITSTCFLASCPRHKPADDLHEDWCIAACAS